MTFQKNIIKINQLKILILVISYDVINSNERHYKEKQNWINQNCLHKHIKIELIHCNNFKKHLLQSERYVNYYNCDENYVPGIFNKTILSLE